MPASSVWRQSRVAYQDIRAVRGRPGCRPAGSRRSGARGPRRRGRRPPGRRSPTRTGRRRARRRRPGRQHGRDLRAGRTDRHQLDVAVEVLGEVWTNSGGRVRLTATRSRPLGARRHGRLGGGERMALGGQRDRAGRQRAALPERDVDRPVRAAPSANSRVPSSGSTIQTRSAPRRVGRRPCPPRTARRRPGAPGEGLHRGTRGTPVALVARADGSVKPRSARRAAAAARRPRRQLRGECVVVLRTNVLLVSMRQRRARQPDQVFHRICRSSIRDQFST